VLGILNVRFDYPDGQERFDEISDLAGEDLVLPPPMPFTPEEEVQIRRHRRPLEDESFRKAANFAEVFAKYITLTKHSMGLSSQQAAYGIGRAFHNLRQCFPREDGGTVAFDEYARLAGDYFAKNR
jgi:hypothetical protein